MKHNFFSGFATVVLISASSLNLSSHAEQLPQGDTLEPEHQVQTQTRLDWDKPQILPNQSPSSHTVFQVATGDPVGKNQSQTIATIEAHQWERRQAATLYVRNIPVLTFISSPNIAEKTNPSNSPQDFTAQLTPIPAQNRQITETDPVIRATSVAAKLNQLNRNRIDANGIGLRWDDSRQSYIIEVSGKELVAINSNSDTILPDTTKDIAQDALQATNRLRRQIGNAPPLNQIEGVPQSQPQEIAKRSRQGIRGLASWYGPGFNGRKTASGERFNQNAMTAAHRSLPFGTKVRVTNRNNGRSVVVRINDRGPFIRGRVIDVSAAAARSLGMVSSGVAPVTVEVLNRVR